MVAWAVELSEYGLIYEQRKAVKAQALADFIVEMTKPKEATAAHQQWTLYVDESLNGKGSRVVVILKGLNGITLEYSLKFNF